MKSIVINAVLVFILISVSSCNTAANGKSRNGSDSLSQSSTSGKIAQTDDTKRIKHLNDIANFIAGLPVDDKSELYSFSQTPEWKAYSDEEKAAWDKFKNVKEQATAWRTKEIPNASEPLQTLFYPFGGPDYLFANIYFPNAKNYIMIGLEDPGSAPQFSATDKKDLKKILSLYKDAIADVINLSFFRTNDMKVELKTKAIDGTAPIIMLFLARSGKYILDVKPMVLDTAGRLVYCDNKTKHMAVELKFRNPDDTIVRHIYYLSTNLADPALKQNKPFYKFLEGIDNKSMSYIKSATYLMHKSYFSIIRNTVLNKSTMILQDDSGIAYKYFDQKKWDITLYGTYEKPIDLFKEHYEPDLHEAVKKNAKPLNYRIGYSTKSVLLVAKKKQ
jgi:hypothetical protein